MVEEEVVVVVEIMVELEEIMAKIVEEAKQAEGVEEIETLREETA